MRQAMLPGGVAGGGVSGGAGGEGVGGAGDGDGLPSMAEVAVGASAAMTVRPSALESSGGDAATRRRVARASASCRLGSMITADTRSPPDAPATASLLMAMSGAVTPASSAARLEAKVSALKLDASVAHVTTKETTARYVKPGTAGGEGGDAGGEGGCAGSGGDGGGGESGGGGGV